MKTVVASFLAAISVSAKDCDIMCAMIYSQDPETCMCVPIAWMECAP